MQRRWVRRALPVLITAVVVAPTAAYANHVFDDVKDGSTHAAGIEYVASKGITKGCDADSYCPDDPVTRDQMATFLHRASGNASGIAPSVNADKVDGLDASQLGGGGDGGVSGYEVVVGTAQAYTNETLASATVQCPAGKKALGGGAESDRTNWIMTYSAPISDGSVWNVGFKSEGGVAGDVSITPYAICATTS